MDRVTKLEAQLGERKKDLTALLADATKADRAMTTEERERAEVVTADLEAIETTLKIERRQLEYDRTEAKPIATADKATDPARFATVGEQLQAVFRGSDSRLVAAASGLSEGVPSDGGFLVQTDFATELTNKAFKTGILSSKVRTVEIGANSNGLKMNLADETSRVSSRYGGIIAYWLGEAGLKTASQPKFRQLELTLQKLIGLFYATDELLQDATAISSIVNEWFSDEFGFKLDDGIYNGTGVGQPLGILNSPARVVVAKEAGQTAATIVKANIEKMYARMAPGSLSNADWCINQEVWPQLFNLSQAVGVGGQPVFLPANGMAGAPNGTLLGRPIIPIEQAAALGTEGDITFCDCRQYLAIRKGGVQSASSIHVRFLYDETAFRFVTRFNGAPIPIAPLTPYKGTGTISPFVTLATRA
jgi:HK97 family phage major capsid protein